MKLAPKSKQVPSLVSRPPAPASAAHAQHEEELAHFVGVRIGVLFFPLFCVIAHPPDVALTLLTHRYVPCPPCRHLDTDVLAFFFAGQPPHRFSASLPHGGATHPPQSASTPAPATSTNMETAAVELPAASSTYMGYSVRLPSPSPFRLLTSIATTHPSLLMTTNVVLALTLLALLISEFFSLHALISLFRPPSQ